MAARWKSAGGTNYELWRSDSANLLNAYPGLRALQWIDSTYHVRWVEPLAGNEGELERDVLAGERSAQGALRAAAETSRELLTPPTQMPQGYAGFSAYLPVRRDGRFDGFIAGRVLGARPLQRRGRHPPVG